MTLNVVPTFATNSYVETVSLDGTAYVLTFFFNTREETWHLSVASADGTALVSGLSLVPEWNLLGKSLATDGIPPGLLFVFAQGDDAPPDLAELGADLRCELLYDEAL